MAAVSLRKEEIKRLIDILGERFVGRVRRTRDHWGPECPKQIQAEQSILQKLCRERAKDAKQ